MIVDTDGTDCVTALFTFGAGTVMRGYTIHVLQFESTNEMGGPPGCLQFFTGAMGTVSTFNWQTPTTSRFFLLLQYFFLTIYFEIKVRDQY